MDKGDKNESRIEFKHGKVAVSSTMKMEHIGDVQHVSKLKEENLNLSVIFRRLFNF